MAAKQLSQNEMARELEISPAQLINLRKGNWDKISNKLLQRVANYFSIDDWKIRDTRNMRIIRNLCNDAKENSRFLAISAYSGAGKTTAARHFARVNAHTYYVLSDFMMSRREFAAEIQRAMGISEGGKIRDMVLAISSKLNSLERPLILIDDAGKLNDGCMRTLQLIYDQTEFNAGLVLLGTEYLKDNIDKGAARNRMGFRELRRRIAYWQALRKPNRQEIAYICADYGISDEKVVSYIYNRCQDYGTVRNMVTNSVKLAKEKEMSITPDLLDLVAIGDRSFSEARRVQF